MGGAFRKGQVALYVLLGIIILMAIALAIYFLGAKRASVTVGETPGEELAANPELAAEKERSQERLDTCLGQISSEVLDAFGAADVPVNSVSEAEAAIAEEIAGSFPDCYFRFNTAGKLTIADDGEPDVSVSLGERRMTVTVAYASVGDYEGETYTLERHTASIETNVRQLLERMLAIRQTLAARVGGLTAPSYPIPDDRFIDEECAVDLYAYADEGIYADILTKPDGSMTAYFHDYATRSSDGRPYTLSFDLGVCTPKTPAPEQPQTLQGKRQTCADNPCLVEFDVASLPEGFTILSSLAISPLTLMFDPSGYAPGEYAAVATGTDADGKTVTQTITIMIPEATA